MQLIVRDCGRQAESWETSAKTNSKPRRGDGIEPRPSALRFSHSHFIPRETSALKLTRSLKTALLTRPE